MPKCQSLKMLQIRKISRRITHLLYKDKMQRDNEIKKLKTSTKRQENKNEQRVVARKRKKGTFYKEENKKQNKIQMEKMGNKKQRKYLKSESKNKNQIKKINEKRNHKL